MIVSVISLCILPFLLHGMPVGVGSNASPASDFHFGCQGVSALSLDWRQGASAFPLAMCARLCWCALAVGVALGSLHDNEPMQADEPPTVRGDAPRGLFTPRCNRPMGLNVLGG